MTVYGIFYWAYGSSNSEFVGLYKTYTKAKEVADTLTSRIWHEDYDSHYEVRTLGVHE